MTLNESSGLLGSVESLVSATASGRSWGNGFMWFCPSLGRLVVGGIHICGFSGLASAKCWGRRLAFGSEGEGEDGEDDGEAREGDEPPGGFYYRFALGEHGAPAGGGRLDAKAKVGEACFGEDGGG